MRTWPLVLTAFVLPTACVSGSANESGDMTEESGSSSNTSDNSDTSSSGADTTDADTDTPESTDETDTGETDTGDPDRPTYYVSVDGDDGNPGTEALPWLTIQHAAETIIPGDLVVVMNGDYGEAVVIEHDGESEARLSFRAQNSHGAKVRSFVVRGDFVDVIGFEVEGDLEAATGVFVDAAHEVVVEGCYVHDCPHGGINVSGTSINELSSDVSVLDNLIEHNGQWGVHVVGSRVLVEGNEVSDTVQHHPKGEAPGNPGTDADGLLIFGDHHIIRGNFIHDIADPADAEHNIDPHADCIQTWDRQDQGGRPVMTDSVIERNHCIIQHPSGKGLTMSAIYDNPCHHITVRNNVFEFRDEGIDGALGLFNDIYVYNNVFKANLDDGSWGTSMHLSATTQNYDVRNNIMVDCHPQARQISSPDGIVDYNLIWYSGGTPPAGNVPGIQANELWLVDPMFVDYDGGVGGDFHLQAGSPAIDAGASLAEVSDDYDGNPRPQGLGHDIGAYEQ